VDATFVAPVKKKEMTDGTNSSIVPQLRARSVGANLGEANLGIWSPEGKSQ